MPIEAHPIKLKASFYTITVLQLNEYDPHVVAATLQQWAANTPQLLQGMPVIIDIPEHVEGSDVSGIVSCIRRYGLVPIGIQGIKKEQAQIAKGLNLALFSRQKRDMSQTQTHHEKESIKQVIVSPTVIESVRSGQQVQVEGDLIVLQSVSLGAEVSAEGNIHIYGTLKGRAFAGTKGNKKASIFCNEAQAELVAIAGCYWQYEDLQKATNTHNVQIYLANESLCIRSLG